MSSNLLKKGYTVVKQDDVRVINVNELIAKRMEDLAVTTKRKDEKGFVSGLAADVIVTAEEGAEAGAPGDLVAQEQDAGRIVEAAEREAEKILEDARARATEIEQIAATQAQTEKERVLEQARQQGYAEGYSKAQEELARVEKEFREKTERLELEYRSMADELEPQFVDTITGIYEHIFNVELSSYRDILSHLISSTMRKTEGSTSFLIHVSQEDYPYVSMQKKQIMADAAISNAVVEVIEDMALSTNECMIETENGIFDCGLGIQLSELRQKLKLLSYEK